MSKTSKTAKRAIAAAKGPQAVLATVEAIALPAVVNASGQQVTVIGVDPSYLAPVQLKEFPYRRTFDEIKLHLEDGQSAPEGWPAIAIAEPEAEAVADAEEPAAVEAEPVTA